MKKINKFLFIVVIFIFLLFISDFIFLLIEKKLLILTSYNGEKYSSIFYDVYNCNDEKVIKSKFLGKTICHTFLTKIQDIWFLRALL